MNIFNKYQSHECFIFIVFTKIILSIFLNIQSLKAKGCCLLAKSKAI